MESYMLSSYFDPNNNTQEGEISNYDGINTKVTDSRMPYLLKMTTVHHNEPEIETEAIFDLEIDLGYYLYELFYPYTNYQSLLFSQRNLYEKLKKQKNFKLYEEEEEEEEEQDINNTEITMDWNNIGHILRISGLLNRLLRTAGPKGICEIAIYQMFSSPSPQRIIYELRFGLYTNLCCIHMDRFGRRTFYFYDKNGNNCEENYFFHNNLLTETNLFNEIDVSGLTDFIKEDKQQQQQHKIQKSQTKHINDDKNVAKTINNKPIPSPIDTLTVEPTKQIKKKKKGKHSGSKSNSANSSPRRIHTITRNGRVTSPINKKRKVPTTTTTITTTIRSKSKKKENSLVTFENYAITSLFKRRLSARNERLIAGLQSSEKHDKNIEFRRHNSHRKDIKKRRRKITIEDMGNGKWCTIQLNHQFLVHGFIRNIAKLLPLFLTVPLSIVKLIGMFYYYSSHLLLISGSMQCENTKHNQLHILGISNKKRYKIKLNRFRKEKEDKNHKNDKPNKKTKLKYYSHSNNTPHTSKKKQSKLSNNNNSLSVSRKKMEEIRKRKSSTPTQTTTKTQNKKNNKNDNNNNNKNTMNKPNFA